MNNMSLRKTEKKMRKWVKKYLMTAESLIATSGHAGFMNMTPYIQHVLNTVNEQVKDVGLWRVIHVRYEIRERKLYNKTPYISRNYKEDS